MKIFIIFLSCLMLLVSISATVSAQNRKVTVILLRHAEKNKAEEAISLDPSLSDEGRARAERLVDAIGIYDPEAFFASAFRRTRATVAPIAWRGNPRQMIQYYDHKNLQQIAETVKSGRFRSVVVAGHNSTTPALVNLLIGEEKYKALDENEYDKIWIVEIERKNGKPVKASEKIIRY